MLFDSYLDNCNDNKGIAKDSGEAGQVERHSKPNVGHPGLLVLLALQDGGGVDLGLGGVEVLRYIEQWVRSWVMVVGGIRRKCCN